MKNRETSGDLPPTVPDLSSEMGEIGELQMEELVPEWFDEKTKKADSRDKVKHYERSDQLFLEDDEMKVAEQE